MTEKHASEMTPEESAAWLRAHSRRVRDDALAEAKPEPLPTDKLAKTMTVAEQAAFKRKFGL
jgi:hypothetical protein